MSKNTNRDYLIIVDVKSSTIREFNKLEFYINDKESHNIFVQLVIKESHDIINKYAPIDDPNLYELAMNIVKPTNEHKRIIGELISLEDGLYEFKLPQDCCDKIGTYVCELETIYNSRVTNSNRIKYRIKKSVLNDLDEIVDAPGYPIVIQLFDKLSDIDQYEEDRRANELARQLAEQQRQTRFNALDADMTDSIQTIDNKVVEVENRVSAKEQAVDKLINDTKADIDEYKVAKDQEIDDYKTAKDTEINNAITAQDNKIDTTISNQNDRIAVVENNDTQQDNRLDIVENKNQQQDNRLTAVEAKNVEQDNRLNDIEAIDVAQNNRLDVIEAKNSQQDDRLLDIEKVNKRQDMNLKCLFAESKNNMIDIAEEGNSIYLQNSTIGYTLIDEIKGNTLVNCNKEPNKELILNGNINTSGDNTVTITEGVDGGLVDVALEGNTLVNVSKTKDSTALPLEEELTYLYANTQYTLQFISDKATTADITLGGTSLLAQNIVKGLNRISITTPATLVDNKLIIDGNGANISEVVVTDTDREFGYFEGMKSVGECEELEIKSGNKNLFDEKYLLGGEVVTFNGKKCYKYIDGKNNFKLAIDFKPNTRYVLTLICYREDSDKSKNIVININYTDGTTTIISAFSEQSKFVTSDEGKTIESITGSWNWENIVYIDLEATQLEEGTIATDYIPHQHNTQQLTHEPLRAVGDVKDRYVLIDGKWYIERNCGSATFDGSDDENWIIDNQGGDNGNTADCVGFKTEIDDMVEISGSFGLTQTGIKLKCNLFPCVPTYDERINGIDYGWGKFLFIKFDRAIEQNEFRNYLKTNPLEVVYPLATPVYEPINYNPFETYTDTTHITTNSIMPTNIIVKNHGFNCLLKPSTTYTVSSNLGLNTVTTPSTLTEDCLRFMDTDTSDVTTMKDVLILEGDWTTKADLIPDNFSGIKSAFEQEYDAEKGKYKVNIKVANEDKSKENNITFYIKEPLRGVGDVKDRVYVKDDKVVVQRNCGIRAYEDGDFGIYPTDKVNTVYPLAEPVYEEVEYNDTKLFIESFKNSTLFYNSNVPVTSKLYYSYSVPIVDTVAQTADVTDQQDSMIIDLATQCAVMEIMLM